MAQQAVRMDLASFERLIAAIRRRGYAVYAPVSGGPEGGWNQIDAPEPMELKGPPAQGPKRLFHRSKARLISIERSNGSWRVEQERACGEKLALVGVHACDLEALKRLDRVLLGDRYKDTHYEARRKDALLVAFNCIEAAETCFCASMETGPEVRGGCDIVMTPAPDGRQFLAEPASDLGGALIEESGAEPAGQEWASGVRKGIENAAAQSRCVDWRKAPTTLDANRENPRWAATAKRCMACGNCTMSCPTCFCVNTVETSSLDLTRSERWRVWDSCFNLNFTYIHGGPVRMSRQARYRHWLTHKFARWIDQFGETGCTGCGRCIRWCPAGIDPCEELASLTNGSN